MAPRTLPALVILLLGLPLHGQVAFQFDYTYDTSNFFVGHTDRQTTLTNAANYVADIISGTSMLPITSTGSDHFNAIFARPDTGTQFTLNDQSVAANTIKIYVGGRNLSSLAYGENGGYSWNGSFAFGLAATTREAQTGSNLHVLPWGGSISFDTTGTSWYFDQDLSLSGGEIGGGNYDFFSVAVHELLHVLGFGNTSAAPAGFNGNTFKNWSSYLSGSNFTGSAADALVPGPGGVPLSDLSHWQDGIQSVNFLTGASQEAAMDPTISLGTRKYITALDAAALTDLGFTVDITPVPEPADFGLIAGLLILLAGRFANRRPA